MNPTLRHKKNLECRNRAEKTLAKAYVPACFFFFDSSDSPYADSMFVCVCVFGFYYCSSFDPSLGA